ncbi:DUF4390 domain-containing protein [Pelistega sp. NLN82]|uniref:DUF4390 domain-containing protein n=1 Tax=Pelistega ratti TaxID=2652177 RepID=A0A6L9Y3K8_9BURK|nr:DUF4390 domain-containing protein [Pelistega ratti]NEN74873.1 DUF4390 domain-containing protein [Pelistega ratti]
MVIALCFSPLSYAETNSQAFFHRVEAKVINPQQLQLGVDIDLQLSNELKSALHKGMPLFFTLDVKLYEPRQFWFNRLIHQDSYTMGLRYNMLLREWRVSSNQREFKAFSLEDAVKYITHLNNWRVLLTQSLQTSQMYEGYIRLRLDTSLLARPFQITAFNSSSAWSFSSSWVNFNFHSLDQKQNK